MTLALPAPISAYLAAKNARDVDAMVAPFADDAGVRDEEHEYRGRGEIHGWLRDVTGKYAVTVEPAAVASAGSKTIVSARISGTFPGSPVMLDYVFTLANERIARLEIG